MSDHILSVFDANMERLDAMLINMGDLTMAQGHSLLKSYKDFDQTMAENVIKADREINRQDLHIDKRTLRILIRHQPMAKDLRLVLSSPKVSTDLERIADSFKAIAAMIVKQDSDLELGKNTIMAMGQAVNLMLKEVMEAWGERDEKKAIEIRERDLHIDGLYRGLFRELVSWMIEDPKNISPCITALLAARYIERCGDRICNICEAIYFVSTGRRLEDIIDGSDEDFDVNMLDIHHLEEDDDL